MENGKTKSTLRDKINVFIKPPGWFPAHLGGFKTAPEIDPLQYKKYDPQYHQQLTGYVIVQFLVGLIAGSAILFLNNSIPVPALISGTVFVILTLLTCGALLEEKKWQVKFEYARLILGILIVLLQDFPVGYQVIFSGLNICSVVWFYNLQKKNVHVEEIPEV